MQRKETLTKLKEAYQAARKEKDEAKRLPTDEIFYLVAIVLAKPLERWAKQYEKVVLPSAILERLEIGLRRNKRYLGLWLERWLKRRLKNFILTQEALAVFQLWTKDETSHQAPSDPFRLKTIMQAISKLSAKDREIIAWLTQGKSTQEIAMLRGINEVAAWKQISRAREALRDKLPKDFFK